MKILILCPGSFVHNEAMTGLYSPERGEGRWAQNYAQMLALAGHEVFAASGGIGESKEIIHLGVRLLDQANCKEAGPFDLYIDAAWWKDKEPKAEAKRYIALKWALEGYLREESFPPDFYLAYPYPSHRHFFSNFPNSGRTFALPTMFGITMIPPNWSGEKLFLPGKIDKNRDYLPYLPVLTELLAQYPSEGCSASFFREEFPGVDFGREGCNLYEKATYNGIEESFSRSRLSLPILGPGCIIEAALHGVPSVFWEQGGFYNPFGRLLDICIPQGAPPERLRQVVTMLMEDRKAHSEAVLGLQAFFSCHLYSNALKYFNLMVDSIF